MTARARDLTTAEINMLLHLLRVGYEGHRPVLLLSGGREMAGKLARLGLIDIWHRQSIANARTEGPFYSLTPDGRERATALYLRRQSRAAVARDLERSLLRSIPTTRTTEELPDADP